jgi:hypothetical protein
MWSLEQQAHQQFRREVVQSLVQRRYPEHSWLFKIDRQDCKFLKCVRSLTNTLPSAHPAIRRVNESNHAFKVGRCAKLYFIWISSHLQCVFQAFRSNVEFEHTFEISSQLGHPSLLKSFADITIEHKRHALRLRSFESGTGAAAIRRVTVVMSSAVAE